MRGKGLMSQGFINQTPTVGILIIGDDDNSMHMIRHNNKFVQNNTGKGLMCIQKVCLTHFVSPIPFTISPSINFFVRVRLLWGHILRCADHVPRLRYRCLISGGGNAKINDLGPARFIYSSLTF